jgi:hypothetical protein
MNGLFSNNLGLHNRGAACYLQHGRRACWISFSIFLAWLSGLMILFVIDFFNNLGGK